MLKSLKQVGLMLGGIYLWMGYVALVGITGTTILAPDLLSQATAAWLKICICRFHLQVLELHTGIQYVSDAII